MARFGFVSVPAVRRSAPVVARRCGRLVWAVRVFSASSCFSAAPACLFVPVRSPAAAGLRVPACAVKVCLPSGVSAGAARGLLRPLACLAGVFARG